MKHVKLRNEIDSGLMNRRMECYCAVVQLSTISFILMDDSPSLRDSSATEKGPLGLPGLPGLSVTSASGNS